MISLKAVINSGTPMLDRFNGAFSEWKVHINAINKQLYSDCDIHVKLKIKHNLFKIDTKSPAYVTLYLWPRWVYFYKKTWYQKVQNVQNFYNSNISQDEL